MAMAADTEGGARRGIGMFAGRVCTFATSSRWGDATDAIKEPFRYIGTFPVTLHGM
jgi:hypothetical protein